MIKSTLPQLLDGFANVNISACLIQYHYYLVISCCQKLILQLNQLLLLSRLSCFKSSDLSKKCSSSSIFPIVHCLQILSSLFRPFHLSQFKFSVQQYLLLAQPTSSSASYASHPCTYPYSHEPATFPSLLTSIVLVLQLPTSTLHSSMHRLIPTSVIDRLQSCPLHSSPTKLR